VITRADRPKARGQPTVHRSSREATPSINTWVRDPAGSDDSEMLALDPQRPTSPVLADEACLSVPSVDDKRVWLAMTIQRAATIRVTIGPTSPKPAGGKLVS
jgi:hypothetical protein